MDTTKGELSFVMSGINLGVAYEGIPLDKPLVPCVLLSNIGDSVELDLSEVKENVNSAVPVPSNPVYKEPETVEEAVEMLKRDNDPEICAKILSKLKEMTVDNGKRSFISLV